MEPKLGTMECNWCIMLWWYEPFIFFVHEAQETDGDAEHGVIK